MNPYEKKHLLDGLDVLSFENLQAGRITMSALAFAVKACEKYHRGFNKSCLGGALGGSSSDIILADMLNDMLEAAKEKEKKEEEESEGCPNCDGIGRDTCPLCAGTNKPFPEESEQKSIAEAKTYYLGNLERFMQIAQDTKKKFHFHKHTGKWAWTTRGDDPCVQAAELALGRFDSFWKALCDAVEPYVGEDSREKEKDKVENETIKDVIALLKDIHDEADHLMGTEARNLREVVGKNAPNIKRWCKEAIKKLEEESGV